MCKRGAGEGSRVQNSSQIGFFGQLIIKTGIDLSKFRGEQLDRERGEFGFKDLGALGYLLLNVAINASVREGWFTKSDGKSCPIGAQLCLAGRGRSGQ